MSSSRRSPTDHLSLRWFDFLRFAPPPVARRLAAVDLVQQSLMQALDETYERRKIRESAACESSPMHSDGESAKAANLEPLFDSFRGTVHLLLGSLDDHIELFAEGLESTRHLWALGTVVRGAAEAALRASWLLDPGIDWRQRMARTATERLYSEFQLRRAVGVEPDAVDRYRCEISAARGYAQILGVDFLESPHGAAAVGERRATTTALFERMMQYPGLGATTYSHLSARAHGTDYGLSSGVFEVVDGDATDIHERRLMLVTLDAALATIAYLEATSCETNYFGWDECAAVVSLSANLSRALD